MKKYISCFLLLFHFWFYPQTNNITLNDLLAFPTAEGFGKFTVGGRGGDVYHVTNLNNNGPGSFRYGVTRQDGYTGRRTIVFDVGGDIIMSNDFNDHIAVPGVAANSPGFGGITIAGQTAPSPGIALKNNGIRIYTGDFIIRYFTIRSDDNGAAVNANSPGGLTFRNWDLGVGYTLENVMLDHLTISHAGNENLVISSDNPNTPMRNTTISNSMFGKMQGDGNALFFYNLPNTSIIRNYWHHCERRNPLISGALNQYRDFPIEYINNINYGMQGGVEGDRTVKLDMIANIYKSTSAMPTVYYPFSIVENQKNGIPAGAGQYYASGNFVPSIVRIPNGNTGNFSPELQTYNAASRRVTNSLYNNYLTVQSNIEESVFAEVGNSLYRDAYDQQMIDDYYAGTGDYSLGTRPSKTSSSRPGNFYVSNPDIPETFVQAHGITSNNQIITNWDFGTYTVTNNAGYTALDIYLAWVAGDFNKMNGTIGPPPIEPENPSTSINNPRATNTALLNN